MKTLNKIIYFASDFHLGSPDFTRSRLREKKIVSWLRTIKPADSLYLVGDIFDFWFEYKQAVPRGYTRLLGTLASLKDAGTDIKLFCGNHDLWYRDYFQEELGIEILREPLITRLGEKQFYIAHGDGLGPGDNGYKLLKKVFLFKPNQFLYRWLHPDIGIPLAWYFSSLSRNQHEKYPPEFYGENEWLVKHAREILKKRHIDYFIFGHRHIPVEYPLNENSTYINLGDWITHFSYGEFDGNLFRLKTYTPPPGE